MKKNTTTTTTNNLSIFQQPINYNNFWNQVKVFILRFDFWIGGLNLLNHYFMGGGDREYGGGGSREERIDSGDEEVVN